MSKKAAVSLTLSTESLLWLRAKALRDKSRSLSETVDRIVMTARRESANEVKSVVGTVTIDAADPDLEGADAAVQALFESSSTDRAGSRRPVGKKPNGATGSRK